MIWLQKLSSLIALLLLASTLFIPIMKIEFMEMKLLDFAINPYAATLIALIFFFTLLSFYNPKFSLLSAFSLLAFFLFLSFSKMHAPEYLAGYWLLLASSLLFLFSYTLEHRLV